jgi:hypothetical protein
MRSLSLLVCVVLLLATGCQKSQERAIAEIEELGGFAKTASDQPGSPVVNVLLYGEKITDSKLAVVETFAQLQTLDLQECQDRRYRPGPFGKIGQPSSLGVDQYFDHR